jgi:hypothetical protein
MEIVQVLSRSQHRRRCNANYAVAMTTSLAPGKLQLSCGNNATVGATPRPPTQWQIQFFVDATNAPNPVAIASRLMFKQQMQ